MKKLFRGPMLRNASLENPTDFPSVDENKAQDSGDL